VEINVRLLIRRVNNQRRRGEKSWPGKLPEVRQRDFRESVKGLFSLQRSDLSDAQKATAAPMVLRTIILLEMAMRLSRGHSKYESC